MSMFHCKYCDEWMGYHERHECPELPRLTERVAQIEANDRRLTQQLIDVRDRHQKLEDQAQWSEGEVRLAGMGYSMRWRGELFISYMEPLTRWARFKAWVRRLFTRGNAAP